MGHVAVASLDEICVIRFSGEVRFNQCNTITAYIEQHFQNQNPSPMIVDLIDAKSLDSTALGAIAQVAILMKELKLSPAIILANQPDVCLLLKSVCFDRVFTILGSREYAVAEFSQLQKNDVSEQEMARHVMEAHENLMLLSESNRALFSDVTKALKASELTGSAQ